MKRIIYLMTDISAIGGREKIVLEKALYLSNKGYEIYIISYKLENKELEKKYFGINFISLECERYLLNKNKSRLQRYIFLKKLKKLLQVQINNINPDIIIGLCDLGMFEYLKLKTTAKKILEIHGCYSYYYEPIKQIDKYSFFKKYKRKYSFFRFKKRINKYDKVVILSEIDREKWKVKNMEVISNFHVNKKKILIKDKFEEKVFLSAGRLSFEKGYDILIDVWKEVIKVNKKIKIDIFGEGVEGKKISSLIIKNNLQNNIYIYPFTNKLNEKYKEYYGYVLPSRFESFPMVVLESINNGVPVIAFEIECGIKDMITSNKEGFLIEKYDCKKMSEKIIELYNSEKLREEMSKKSLEKSKEYTSEKVMKKWIDLFEEL